MITVVVGAQYGGEGKGKICSYLGRSHEYTLVCRTGGVNSSHTVVDRARTWRLRMMPASLVVRRSVVVYGAGSLIHLPTLLDEAKALGISPDEIVIDPRAGIVTDDCVRAQRADARYASIGSTLTGTGYASAMRCMRRLPLAADFEELSGYLADTSQLLYNEAICGRPILIEGHQGAGLSNYHGDYPFTSSRDCTAAALLSEVGLGPNLDLEIVLVVKVFPTRNHGGRLPGELSTAEADRLGISEHGGGSWGIPDKRRRVGRMDFDELRRAVQLNTPNFLALTGIDYLFPELRGASERRDVSMSVWKYIDNIQNQLGVDVGILSTGPDVDSTINLRAAQSSRFERISASA